jgi:hypothetical protein
MRRQVSSISDKFEIEATGLIGVGFEIDFGEIPNFFQDRCGW